VRADVIQLITVGSYEQQLCGPNCVNLCFDEKLVRLREMKNFQRMTGETIELMLRETAKDMFCQQSSDLESLSAEVLLRDWICESTAVRHAWVDDRSQRKFWTQLLDRSMEGPKTSQRTDSMKKHK
jgi:hypothetical protein